jgi:hypothetical protein
MIHELRIYRVMPGKMPALLDRFEKLVVRYWEKHGIRQVGCWTTEIGPSHLDFYHLLAWESLEERERKFSAFMNDPDRQADFVESERDGVMVASLSNAILRPTRFSGMQ